MPSRTRLIDFMTSRAPHAIGLCNSDVDGCAAFCNEIQQRLLSDPMQPDEGFWGTWGRMAFNVTRDNPYITAPREVARITAIDVCKRPMQIRNEWYEFLDFGTGLRGGCGSVCEPAMAFQRGGIGGTVVTAFDFKPPNKIIRIYPTNSADIGKHVLIQGKDQFGAPVTSTDGSNIFSGEFLTLAQPFTEGSEELSELTGIQKDLTNGQVQIFQVNTDTGEQSLLTIMEASEEVSGYHRIYINNLPGACCREGIYQITAMVKLAFVPVRVSTDYLLIGNLPALIAEAQAIRMESMDSASSKQQAAQYHAKALSFLGGELDHFVGRQRVSVSVPLWNSDRLRHQPV